MMQFSLRWIFGLMLLPQLVFAQQERPARNDTLTLNLDEVVRYALSVSPEVGQMQAKVDFAEARHRLARASRYVPEFNATTAHALAPTLTESDFPRESLYLDPELRNDWSRLRMFNQIEIEAIQPIYTWGQLSGSIEAAEQGIGVASAEVRSKTLEVVHRTSELYYSVLLTEALYRLAEETGKIVDEAKRQIRRLLDEGADDVDDADLFQVEIVEQEYLRRVVEVEEKRKLAYSALRRQLFLPDDVVIQTKDTELEPLDYTLASLEAYQAQATKNRPELAQAEAGLAARDALVRIARSDLFPKLFLGVSGRWTYTPGRVRQPNPFINDRLIGRSVQAGFGFRQNLNFAQTRARIQQATANRDEVHFQKEGAQQLIRFEVEQAYRNLIITTAALESQNRALQISKEWLRTEQINFDLALGDTENLVRAVQANLDLKARYYEMIQRYNVTVLRLFRATGTLLEID